MTTVTKYENTTIVSDPVETIEPTATTKVLIPTVFRKIRMGFGENGVLFQIFV